MMERVRKSLIGLMLALLLIAPSAQHASRGIAAEESPERIFLDGFETAPVDANIVINEVDYVQPGIDDGEFIELYNPGPDALSLVGLSLELIDGADDTPYAAIPLNPVLLGAGAFFVVCDDPERVPNCDQQVSLTVPWIQDGIPDGVALTSSGGVIDALSYGGTLGVPWAEGAGTSAVDATRLEGISLGRFPDGADSDDNDADFRQGCITPGMVNAEVAVDCPTFRVSGTVSGLQGSGLVLQIDREQIYNLAITQDGAFQFAKEIENGSDYEVRVFLQPTEPNQTCSVTRGVGFIAGADITDVAVVCVNDGTDFSVGGTVSGLVPNSSISLVNNYSEIIFVFFNGPFAFPQKQANGTDYDVIAVNAPTSPVTCGVSNGAGTIAGADVTDIEVDCIPTTYSVGGTVNGLVGSGLVLQNNGADDLPINGNGIFTFAGELEQGEAYAVTVKTQPSGPSQTCFVSGGGDTEGGGIITENDITTIQVTCAIDNPLPGAVVITEVMADPLGTENEVGEWFEVRSLSSDYLFLKDCTLSNDATQHLITAEALVAPNETVVFVRDAAQAVRDRFLSPYFLYSDINLDNNADSLSVSCDSTLVDAMNYAEFTEGAARQLDVDTLDPAANDDLSNWCDATSSLNSGNLGTPGGINRSCP